METHSLQSFGTYINKTDEGIMQKTMLLRLQASWMVDAEKVSQENLINKEHQVYISKVESINLKVDDELKNAQIYRNQSLRTF